MTTGLLAPFRGRRRRLLLASVVGLALLGGLGLAWSLHDPWPARVVIRPPAESWPQGFDRDGRSYRTSSARGVSWWDVRTGDEVRLGPLPVVWGQAWTDDGRSYAGVAVVDVADTQAAVWVDAASGEFRAQFPVPNRNVMHPRLVDGGRAIRAALVSQRRVTEVATWDLATDTETRRAITGPAHLVGAGQANPIAYSPDGGTWAYLDSTRGGILLWDAEADRPHEPFLPTPAARLNHAAVAAFSPDGRLLAVGRDDGRIELWDVPAARLLRVVAAHPGDYAPNQLNFSPDGKLLASAAHEPGSGWSSWARSQFNRRAPAGWQVPHRREVVVLDVPTGQVLARSPGSIHPQFSPDGRTLATHEADGSFSLRDIPARP